MFKPTLISYFDLWRKLRFILAVKMAFCNSMNLSFMLRMCFHRA